MPGPLSYKAEDMSTKFSRLDSPSSSRSSLPALHSVAEDSPFVAVPTGAPRSDTMQTTAPRTQSEDARALEDQIDICLRICQQWNDVTSVITIVLCVVALLLVPVAPTWIASKEELDYEKWSFPIAATIAATAFLFEVGMIMTSPTPDRRLLDLVKETALTGYQDSCVMLFIYSVLMITYSSMTSGMSWVVHTDPLAFGGPRPVYTIRYLEWSIVVPLLMAVSGTYPKAISRESDALMHLHKEEPYPAADEPTQDFASLVWQIAERVMTMPLAASARCTSAYIWSSWLALVVDDEPWRWILLTWSYFAFVVAAAEQIAVCFKLAYQESYQKQRLVLLIIQLLLFYWYGVIFLLAVFGCVSAQMEQAMYSFSDLSSKVFHSLILVTARRQDDIQHMAELASTLLGDLRRMMQTASAPIFCVNRCLEIVAWNKKMAELTSVNTDDALGRRVTDFVTQEEGECWNEVTNEVLQKSIHGIEMPAVEIHFSKESDDPNTSKAMLVLSATPQRNIYGDIRGAFCIGQDLTEIHRQRQKAQHNAESLARLIDSANAPIFGIDGNYRISEWNSWLSNRSGVAKDEALGMEIYELIAASSKHVVKRVIDEACRGLDTSKFDLGLLTRKGDKPACLLLSATPFFSHEGQIVGAICVGQEITHLQELEDKKSTLMAMVSHELKSPLHGILGLSQTLLTQLPTTSEFRKPLSMVHNCAKRMLDMVSNMMDASVLVKDRKMRMTRDPVQVASIIEEVVLLCQQAVDKRGVPTIRPGVQLISNIREPLPVIEADAYRCTQLIYNLVSNALKFTHQGSVTVSASDDSVAQLIIIDVKDTGIGIAPENLERIFQPFDQEDASESRRYEGLGLGLAISREVVVKHGGSLSVKSQQGKGSTFRAVLPYKMAAPSSVEEPAVPEEQPRALSSTSAGKKSAENEVTPMSRQESQAMAVAKRSEATLNQAHGTTLLSNTKSVEDKPSTSPTHYGKGVFEDTPECRRQTVILSVDDDFVNQEVMDKILQSEEFQVRTAMDGSEALNFIKMNPLPALVLLDVMMPGLSGQNVLRQLRKSYGPQELPVLMVSAKGDQETINKLFKSGCNDYIRKPFSGAELLNRMKHHLTMASLARTTSGTSDEKSTDHRASEDSKSSLREADMAGALSETFTGILPENLQQTLFTALCSNPADKSVQMAKDKLRRWLDQERGTSSSRIVSLENELQRKTKEIADLNRQLKFQEEYARKDREESRLPSVKQAAKDKSRYATAPALDSASQHMRQISRQTSDKSQSSEPLQRQVSPKLGRQISASQKEDHRHPPLQERCQTIQEDSDDPITKGLGQQDKLIYQQHRFLLRRVDTQQKQLTKLKEEFLQHQNEFMSAGRFSSFPEAGQGTTFQLPATEEKLFLHLLDQEQRFSNIVLKVPLPEQHDLLNFWASVQQQLVFLVVERERQQARMREAEIRLKQQLAIILQFQKTSAAQLNFCYPGMIS